MGEKKYYWFKMEDDFFQKKEIKKLRQIAGGDTFVIIYLKLILKSLKTSGKLLFEGFEDTFSEEMALEIDEKPDNVKVTIAYLLKNGLVEEKEVNEFIMNDIGIESKTSSAFRIAKFRLKQKESTMLQSNVLPLHCNSDVTDMKQNGNGEKEIEKELELEKKKELELEKKKKEILFFSNEQYKPIWDEWLRYKKKQHKFSYADISSEQKAVNKLIKISGNNPVVAQEIIDQSMISGWQGFFEIKNEKQEKIKNNLAQRGESVDDTLRKWGDI